jgi:hypothetical protein
MISARQPQRQTLPSCASLRHIGDTPSPAANMVFPAVSRPPNGPTPDVETSPHTVVPRLPLRPTPEGSPYAQFEACLAEVRLLELGLVPHAGEQWATRYRAANDARNAECAAYWRRHLVMASLHTALATALLAVTAAGAVNPAAVAAGAALGLGLTVAWAMGARAGAHRIAGLDARVEALDGAAPFSEAASAVVADAGRPASTGGTALVVVAFGGFWLVLMLACLFAAEIVVGTSP